MIKTFAAAGAVALWTTAALAAPVDFGTNLDDTDSANDFTTNGESVTSFDFGNGLTGSVSVFNDGNDSAGDAVIYDTRISGGADPDLEGDFTDAIGGIETRDMGKALIIQERASLASAVPDDERAGGIITFVFDQAIDLLGLTYLDGEEGVSVIAGMQQVGGFGSGVSGDNLFVDLDFSGNSAARGITQFQVVYNGSGAIGAFDLQVAAIPLPAGLPLMLLGLGGLAMARRRAH